MGKIKFVYPRKTIPLSLTGESCALNCPHCKGHYLKHMDTSMGREGKHSNGIKSYLVSGGCDSNGAVPLIDNLELLRRLSKKHKVIAHTGLIKMEDVPIISPYIYAASFNFVGDDITIKEMYNLDKSTKDFMESLCSLNKKVNTFPHITIGLHGCMVKGEYNAIDMLSEINTEAVVLNVFIPTKGTEFENFKPPNLEDVKDVISYARRNLNGKKLFLGCMRPTGYYREELDEFCVDIGIDRIVMPSKNARQRAKKMGHEASESEECCII